MDELKDLYSHIENPLDNKAKWNKILNFYSTSENFEDFHSKLIEKNENSKIYYDENDKANFYLIMWSELKKQLLNFSEEEIKKSIEDNKFKSNIYDVIKQLKQLDSIKNIEDLNKILSDNNNYYYFSKLFLVKNNDIEIYSDFDIHNQNKKLLITFTVTINAINLYSFLKKMYQECLAYEISYIIKYKEEGEYIVVDIFSSIENSKKIEVILNVLKKEFYSYFIENKNNLLYGNLNKWISIRTDCNNYSLQRSYLIFKSLDSVIYEYVIRHFNVLVSYKDGKMNLIEYLSNYVMEKIVTKILDRNIRTNSELFSIANSPDLLNLKEYIKSKLAFNMKDILKDRLYLKKDDYKINLKLNQEKTIDIEAYVFMQAIRNLIFALILKDNSLEKSFKIRLKNECIFYKIDSYKFCLSNDFIKKVQFYTIPYDEYKQKIDNIHGELTKLKDVDRLIELEATPERRKKIFSNLSDVLNSFND